jgi:hypothetical protein
MERSIERWNGMVPEEVAKGSEAQIIFALRDAKADIAALHEALKSVLPILEAVRFSVGFGKTQLERIRKANSVLLQKAGS